MLTMDMVYDAKKVLTGITRVTPLFEAQKIGEGIYLKCENLQLTGSFKMRGAYYKINSLTPEEKAKSVITCSAGNHAQGVALSAKMNNIKAYICMPAGAPLAKVNATKAYGAEVILVPGVYDDAYAKALELSAQYGYTIAHPFNDECVLAGQGTIGLEILEQLSDVDQVIVPIGGGGLISGIAFAIKSLKPECKVIGVQSEHSPSMYVSVKNGELTEVPTTPTIADGIIVKKPVELTLQFCQKYVDEIVMVSDDEIMDAMFKMIETQKVIPEGSGAAPVAAIMTGKVDTANKKTVCVVSGGNIDVTMLSRIITKGLSKSGRTCEITTKVMDKPGQLINLLQIVSETGANIVRVNHSREAKLSDITNCVVTMVLETRNREHVEQIENALTEKGYELIK